MTAYTSAQSGNWSEVATWGGGGFPIDGDTAIIADTHVVEVDGDITVGTNPANNTTYVIDIQDGGTLKWPDVPVGDYTLTVKGNIRVNRYGKFYIGTEANPIPAARLATLHFPTDTGAYEWRVYCQGDFQAHGNEAYHMGAADKQRTHLNANITAGAGVTFVTKDAVDWSVGDTIWFGIGGSPYETITTHEKVVIATKTDASTYTADFTYNHYENDHLVQEERNVVIKAGSTTRGAQIWFDQVANTIGSQEDVICKIKWAKFKYMGMGSVTGAALVYDLSLGAAYCANQHIPVGNFKLEGLIFDETGTLHATAIYLNNNDTDFLDGDEVLIDGVHCWGFGATFNFQPHGRIRIRNLTNMSCTHLGLTMSGYGSEIFLDGHWHTGTTQGYNAIQGSPVEIKNAEILYGNIGIYLNASGQYYNNFNPIVIKDSKISGCSNHGIDVSNTTSQAVDIHNVDLDVIGYAGIALRWCSSVLVYDCNFNKCNTVSNTQYGGIQLGYGAGDVYIYNCNFGMVSQNYASNIVSATSWGTNSKGRTVVEKCVFREPIGPDTGDYVTLAMLWSASKYNMEDPNYRRQMSAYRSIEIIDPVVWNMAMDTDQWQVDYPSITRLALIHGGAEVRTEGTVVIDSTLPMKILVFQPNVACLVNELAPVKIPVSSGQTATVKLSLRKTADGEVALPNIRLVGPGFDDISYMTAALLDTWEELTVSGLATRDGLAQFYINAGSGIPKALTGDAPPDIIGGDVDTGFSVIVYTDGLKVTVS